MILLKKNSCYAFVYLNYKILTHQFTRGINIQEFIMAFKAPHKLLLIRVKVDTAFVDAMPDPHHRYQGKRKRKEEQIMSRTVIYVLFLIIRT